MLRSIRHKLLAGFLALGVLPVALVSIYANQTNNGALIHSAGDTLQAHADALMDKIDRNLFERYGDVQAFAFHPNARGTPLEIAAAADFYTKSYVIYDLMLVTDLDGRVISANTLAFDGKPIESQSLIGQSVADQGWFQKIRSGSVKAGETIFDEPERDPMVRAVYGDDRVTLAYSAPVFDDNGKIVRIWSNRVSWERVVGQVMGEFLKAENTDGGAQIAAHVISKDGTILDGPVGASARMETPAAQASCAGKTGFIEELDEESGTDLVTGYSASDGALGFAGYGWGVLLSQDRADVLRAGGGLARILLIAGAITLLVVTLVGLTMASRITKPITGVAYALSQVAEGDFTQHVEITSNDELGHMGESLNKAIEGMRVALSEVQGSASQFVRVSTELSQSSARMSDGSQQQASALEETAASLEEITGTIKQNADSARQASQLAQSSREIAERGGRVVSQAVDSIKEINRSSEKIANIITTIDEIAFQTNLLALNAAVEAARAGEQGRGFAVVASEVRNLAQRSASSAKEIKALIEESLQKVSAGSELVDKSGQSLQEIVASVKRVTEIIAEIAAASQEQATGVDQVNRAVTQMDQVVQGNAGQSAQLASNATTLAGQSRQLQTMVARFRVGNVASPQQNYENPAAPAPSFAAPAAALPHPQQRRAPTSRFQSSPQPEPVATAANDQDGFIEF